MTAAPPLPPPPPNRRRRRRRVLFAAAALLSGLAFAVVMLEVVLRVYDPMPHPARELQGFFRLDGEGRIETTPGWTGSQHVEGRRVAIRTNALGLRGDEVADRRAGERRVLMLGDSFVWGMGVEDHEAIPAVLQAELRRQGLDVTVGNAGMWGTGPREWSYTLARQRQPFAPDLVVAVLYVGNDVLDTLQTPLTVAQGLIVTSDGARAAKESWRFRMRLHSRLWDKVEQALTGLHLLQQMGREKIGSGIPLGDALFLDRDPARDAEMPFLAEVTGVMDRTFAAFAAELRGLPALVVMLPAFAVATRDYERAIAQQNDPGFVTPDRFLDPAELRRGRGHARLRALLERHGLPVVDLSERIFAEPRRNELYFPNDGHLTPAGCRQVAAWLLPEITARLP